MKPEKFYTLLTVPTCAGEKTVSELQSLTAQYPWFSLAHQLLMETTHRRNDEERNEHAAMAAAYAASRTHFYWRLQQPTAACEAEEDIELIDENNTEPLPPAAENPPEPVEKSYIVAGGDYFSPSDFTTIAVTSEDPLTRFITTQPKINPHTSPLNAIDFENTGSKEPPAAMDYVTETLAQIYREQQLYALATETYEKLILQIPEKSAYFATQIQEIKKNK
jgi:hypothetical protein